MTNTDLRDDVRNDDNDMKLAGWLILLDDDATTAYAFADEQSAVDHQQDIARVERSAVTVLSPDGDIIAEHTYVDAPLHVVPRDDGWAVVKEGHAEAPLATCPNKREALAVAREQAEPAGVTVVAHYENGAFQRIYQAS